MIGRLKSLLIIGFIYAIAFQPLLNLATFQTVLAAEEETETSSAHPDDAACLSFARQMYDPLSEDFEYPEVEEGTPTGFLQVIDLTDLKKAGTSTTTTDRITSRAYVDKVINQFGPVGMTYYKSPEATKNDTPGNNEYLFVCNTANQAIPFDVFNPYNPIDPDVYSFMNILQDPSPKLQFVNPNDRYALLGEVCEGGLISLPVSSWTESTVPCPSFNVAKDDKNGNGQWDAPKVDKRVLETLLYLVTPLEQGGAGREFLRIKKLVQGTGDNTLTQPVIPPTVEAKSDSEEASDIDSFISQQYQQGSGAEEGSDDSTSAVLTSAYYVDPSDPPHLPRKLSTAVMIDQIDRMRVSTKIEEKRLFGNNTTTYKAEAPVPIDVSWQSDAGLAKNSPPDFSKLSMLESSRFLTNAAIVQLLSQNGLGDLEIDVSETEINGIGDIASIVGKSLLEQLLGSPKGSMSGWNLVSVLRSIGMAYLEQNLGLVPGSLADLNPLDKVDDTTTFTDLTNNIGRATIEYVLGFPRGSLRTAGGTSAEIMESVGRSYLERKVFQVSDGTLVASNGSNLQNVGDLLERLGEGRIEKVFSLPKQSLRTSTYTSFRQSSFKAGLLFLDTSNRTLTESDYDMADYISGQLSLNYVPYSETDKDGKQIADGSTTMYGFREGEFKFPSLLMAPNSDDSLRRFKQLVGSRVIETSLGLFQRAGTSDTGITGESNQAPPSTIGSWNLTVNGAPVNPQYRPAFDATLTKHQDWCDNVALTYASGKSAGGGGAAFSINGNLDTAGVTEAIDKLSREQGSLTGTWTTMKSGDCTTNETINKDRLFTGLVNSILFDTTKQDRTIFLNQDKAPNINNFNPENDPKGQGENALYWRYNTATVLYYNLAENHRTVPLNYIPTFTSVTENSQDINPDSKPTEPKTVADVLSRIAGGGQADGGDFTWSADPALQQRIEMIRQKQSADNSSGFYDTLALINQNLPATQLDNALIDRLNGITTQPAADQYEAQYSDPNYNGWLFLLQDLRARLDCKISNGVYAFEKTRTIYSCSTPKDVAQPSAQALQELKAAKQLVDRLYKQPWATAQSILAELKTRTYSDPSGYVNQSAMSTSLNFSSVGRSIDANYRFVKDSGCAAGDGCSYSKDMIRALVAPNGAGVVPLNASIEAFFTRGKDNRSLLGESGRQYAALKFSSDALSQTTFAAQLKTDFGSSFISSLDAATLFNLASANARQAGVDEASMQEKGLANGDFSRIFQLDDANSVFERVGKDQLLRTVWKKSGAANAILSSEQYQNLLHLASQIVQEVSFYVTRIDQIKRLSAELDTKLNAVNNDGLKQQIAELRSQLKLINGKTVSNVVQKKEDAEEIVKRYEPTINKLRTTLGKASGQTEDLIETLYEIAHLTQEIVAGRDLPRDSRISASFGGLNDALRSGQDYKATDSCFNKNTLIDTFTGGGSFNTKLVNFGEQVGACHVEQALGLPIQTMYLWYKLGSTQFPPAQVTYEVVYDKNGMPEPYLNMIIDKSKVASPADKNLFEEKDGKLVPLVPTWNGSMWTKDNLYIAAGMAGRLASGSLSIDTTEATSWLADQDADTIKQLMSEGERILSTTLLVKLATMIPGIGNLIRQYGLDIQDVVAIFQGNTRPLTDKIGGGFLDRAFDLPRGTGAQILSPQCFDNNGANAACNRDPNQPGTNPDTVRSQTLAKVGLQKLGLAVPNIPRYFNLFGGGNLAQGWGNAAITADLGLTPNSFVGKITDGTYASTQDDSAACAKIALRCQNYVSTLMNAFGLSATPFDQSLAKIKTAMLSAIQSKETLASTSLVSSILDSEFSIHLNNFDANTAIAHTTSESEITNKTGYWTDFSKLNGIGGAAALAADANRLSDLDRVEFQKTLEELWDMTSGTGYITSGLTGELRVAILRNLPPEIKPSDEEIARYTDEPNILGSVAAFPFELPAMSGQFAGNYATYIRYFQIRLQQLNTQYNLGNHEFDQLLQGKIAAEVISEKVGLFQTADGILGKKIDEYLDNSGPTWLKTLNRTLKLISAEKCPGAKEMGFGSLLTGAVTGTNNCTKLASKFSSKDLLYGTSSEMVQMRSLMFDTFLSNVFSTDLEQQIGLRQGTFRRIAVSPGSARQIMTTEGVYLVTNTIFGQATKDDPCQYGKDALSTSCAGGVLKGLLKEALISGFCDDFSQDKCTTSFNQNRAIKNFNKNVDEGIDRQLRRIGREYLGVEITRKDVAIYNGDMSGIAMIGIQAIANQMNKSLFNGDSGSPMAKFYTTYYNDIRTVMGYNEPAWYEKLMVGGLGVDSSIRETMCSNLSDPRVAAACTNPSTDGSLALLDLYKEKLTKENGLSDEEADTQIDALKNTSFDQAVNNFESTRRTEARNTIQYAMLDIVAFSKDRNIPPNFSKRLLSGNGADQSQALAEYAFTSLLNSKSSLGQFLQSACVGSKDAISCLQSFRDLANSLKSAADMQKFFSSQSGNNFLSLVDNGMTNWFSDTLGIDLPEGTFSGIYVWGTHGFKASDFNTDGYCGGVSVNSLAPGTNCDQPIGIPVGRVLQNAGEKMLASWADKAFGFKPGTSQQIVKLTKLLAEKNKYNTATAAGRLQKTKATIAAAEIAAQLIVGAFSKDLAAFDEAVGLPAGTTATLATAGLTYGLGVAFGASGAAAAAAAFGPAFFIGLGLNLVLGVTRVEVTSRATGDGYYPFYSYLNEHGAGEASPKTVSDQNRFIGLATPRVSNLKYNEAYVHNEPSGEFDPTKVVEYREGLKKMARNKVRGLISDILQMPYSDWAKRNVEYPAQFQISQIFTYGGPEAEYDPGTDSQISEYLRRAMPTDPDNPSYGFGSTEQMCKDVSYDEEADQILCTRNANYRIGLSGLPKLIDAIHVRW